MSTDTDGAGGATDTKQFASDNLYTVLGVAENASDADIKKAYRRLSMKWHPDRASGDEEIFKKVTGAYSVLSDPAQRQDYNFKRQHAGFTHFNMGPRRGPGGGPNINLPPEIARMFGNFFHFAGAGPGAGPRGGFGGGPDAFRELHKPVPIVNTIQISLEQAYTGLECPLQITRWIKTTGGEKTTETETIYVTIMPGVDDNELLIFRGKGNIIDDTLRGDVKVFIKINAHKEFQRRGLDLYIIKKISLKEALCGFTFELQHLNTQNYKIRNSNCVIKPNFERQIPNLGLKRNNRVGNLVIRFEVEFPKELAPETAARLAELL